MQKPLALSIAACLSLAGCQVFQKSETWNEAVRVRPGETSRDPDPSHAYAAKLHAAFGDRGVEHKVVTYQYRYTTRLREEAVGTRTAVVYRDGLDSRYPWWLKDDRLNTPFWLPNGTLDKQLSFYIRRKAEVLEAQQYPAQGGSGKTALAFAKPSPTLRPVAKPESRVAAAKAPVKKAPVIVATHKPVPARVVAKAPVPQKAAPALKPRKLMAKAPQKRKPAPQPRQPIMVAQAPAPKIKLPASFFAPEKGSAPQPLPPIAARGSSSRPVWNPPGMLDANEQSALTAPRDTQLERLFKQKHGTEYNRFSPTDRRKMQLLQQGVASRD